MRSGPTQGEKSGSGFDLRLLPRFIKYLHGPHNFYLRNGGISSILGEVGRRQGPPVRQIQHDTAVPAGREEQKIWEGMNEPMSASREKKKRQELTPGSTVDPKAAREADILYGTLGVLFVALAVFLVVYNSGILERNKTAVTIGGGVLGIGGMLLAVPLAAALYQMLRDDVARRN